MFQLGKETTVKVGNKSYTFSRLEKSIVEEWRDWIKEQIGDPFEIADKYLEKLPPEQARELIAEAQGVARQLKGFSMGCPLAQQWLQSELGMGQLAYLLLKPKHPAITEDEAFAVMVDLGNQMAEVIAKANGKLPEKNSPEPALPEPAPT